MNKKDFIIVAVDGGAASGKSSTSKIISQRLSLLYVNTGSHYRTLTWAFIEAGLDPGDEPVIVDFLKDIPIGIRIEEQEARITLASRLPGEEIRSEPVNQSVSVFAAMPRIREFLLQHQRSYADLAREEGFAGLIMEGRDIGSVIFPEADYRFFMFADEKERTRRRALEGQVDSIGERDKLDQQRKIAPLTCPKGAIRVDTTHMTLEEVADFMTNAIQSGKD